MSTMPPRAYTLTGSFTLIKYFGERPEILISNVYYILDLLHGKPPQEDHEGQGR